MTLHVPKTPLTKNMIRKETLELMKPTAFLINTSRGGVVHEGDLYEALKANRIAGAGWTCSRRSRRAATRCSGSTTSC